MVDFEWLGASVLRWGGYSLVGGVAIASCAPEPMPLPFDDVGGGFVAGTGGTAFFGGGTGAGAFGGSSGALPMGGTSTTGGTATVGGTSGTAGTGGQDDAGAGAGGAPSGGSGGSGNAGGGTDDGGMGGDGGTAGDGPRSGAPSCSGMTGLECRGASCCESQLVPAGSFDQGEPDAFRSSVSSFYLDKYEVNVSRVRRFVTAYDAWIGAGNPRAGAGAHPSIPGSGWDAAWNALLPASVVELTAPAGESLKCAGALSTWLDNAGHELHPINCITWYVSYAFCIWDGGRLPTEAEFEFAAAGGSDDRLYPWGNTPVPVNTMATHAAYKCMGDGSAPDLCSVDDMPPGGAFPLGVGRFGQMDLVGGVGEWVRDQNVTAGPYPTMPRTNHLVLDATEDRGVRGGDWDGPASQLPSAHRAYNPGWEAHSNIGVRCVRDP